MPLAALLGLPRRRQARAAYRNRNRRRDRYVVIAGFFVAAACGYMAGLIGSSNSPVSGLAFWS